MECNVQLNILELARGKRESARLARRLAGDLQGANKARALAFADDLEAKADVLEDQLVCPSLPDFSVARPVAVRR